MSREGRMLSGDDAEPLVVTASLTTGAARVTRGMPDSVRLVDEILAMDHVDWETTLAVGAVEYYSTRNGPYPNHQLRISVRPASRVAALNYMDHDDPDMPNAISFNPNPISLPVNLVFNGTTGAVFPQSAAITVTDARAALREWLTTRRRPICIQWRPYGWPQTSRVGGHP